MNPAFTSWRYRRRSCERIRNLIKLLGLLLLLLMRTTSYVLSSGLMTLGQDKGHDKTKIETCTKWPPAS